MSIHLAILAAMRKAHAASPHPLAQELSEEDATLIRKYFSNYRAGDPDNPRGLRLTPDGLVIMKCFFKNWDVELSSDYRINTMHLIYFDRICTMPWFLSSRQLTLFEPELAMRAKLVGDLEVLKEAFGPPPQT